jgi:sugar/nucleoside kinase (ribokinase family)
LTETWVPDLIVIGDVMLDVTVSSAALARGGDVHGAVRIDPGGSAANVAVWAADAGAAVRLHGCVGDDVAGGVLRESLKQHRVEPEFVTTASRQTGAMLVVTDPGKRSMVAHRGANSSLAVASLPELLEAGAVFVSGYTLLDANTEAVARAALARARATVVAVDAGSWPLIERRGAGWFVDATRQATLLFANEHEAEALTGVRDEDAARRLAAHYEMAVVKLGAQGAVLAWGETVVRVAAPAVVEIDATGAGDAFDGAFLAALVQGASPPEALERACAAGARCAAQPGRWPPRSSATSASPRNQ